MLSKRNLYARGDSPLANVWRYLGQRRVVPTIFGVYRSDAYLAALPFDTFDETIADVDNLFLIKLMTQTKVHAIDEVLFFYRNKYRGYDPSLTSGSPKGKSVFNEWWFFAHHQRRFVKKIAEVVNGARLNRIVKRILRLRSWYTFLIAITVLRLRALIGRALVLLHLRDGPPAKKDIHFEKRVTALQEVGYCPPTSGRKETQSQMKP